MSPEAPASMGVRSVPLFARAYGRKEETVARVVRAPGAGGMTCPGLYHDLGGLPT